MDANERLDEHERRIAAVERAVVQMADYTARVTALLEVVVQLLQRQGGNDAANGR